MRYATENQFMERNSSKEEETEWDSLSDRVKKSRRALQKSLLQKQLESKAIERKDALTNRPIDFDREEETRRKETYKWLDNHFGSESTSKDSRDESVSDDVTVGPIKKSYFNITIKSNNVHNVNSSSLTSNTQKILSSSHRQLNSAVFSNDDKTNQLSAPSKVYANEHEPVPSNKKYFQGISEWSERKESPRPLNSNTLSTKAFREELANTLERKQKTTELQRSSHNDLRYADNSKKVEVPRSMKYRSGSQENLLRNHKEDLGYLSGSRTDLRSPRKYSNDDYAVPIKKKTNKLLHREESGFRNSKEDNGLSPQLEDSFRNDDVKTASIQLDDSAYVSSSTYFTTPRSPYRPRSPVIKTPDSGIMSPIPNNDDFESDELHQPPEVPQRNKTFERKLRVTTKNVDYANYPAKPRRDPPIDYSPSPRSRSVSPLPPIHHVYSDRKSCKKTRFSSTPLTPTVPQSTQMTKKKTVGNAIGNSLRKLVGMKLKLKSSSTSSKRSPSPLSMTRHKSVSNLPSSSSSYQRNDYIIDEHINFYNKHHRAQSTSSQDRRERTIEHTERSGSSTIDIEMPTTERTITTHHQKKTIITSPKQCYYLGENPYGGSMFGKENKYLSAPARDSEILHHKNFNNNSQIRQLSEEPTVSSNVTTLGRFSKSSNRLASKNGFTSALHESNENYRNSQTLPRKLDHHKPKPISQSTINVSIVNNSNPAQNTGPIKPARTYKALQRSKSFNVHGMNGTNDPSPIYMEKLTNNNYKNFSNDHKEPHDRVITTTTHHTTIYKSTPQLNDPLAELKLKSPSIVNLITQSTRDLSQLGGNDHHYIDRRYNSSPFRHGTPDMKNNTYFRGMHDQASDFYKTLHSEDEVSSKNIKFADRESSGSKTSSRSSPTVGKDSPAGILRRGSNSTDNDNYSETFKYQTKSSDPLNPSITDTVETFSKKIIPSEVDARTKKETTVERHEIQKVTTSRNFETTSPAFITPSLKYFDVGHKNENGGVVIELKNNS